MTMMFLVREMKHDEELKKWKIVFVTDRTDLEEQLTGTSAVIGYSIKVAKRIKRAELDNAKILRLDSKYVVEWLLPEASISRIHLLCPDPWPKAKHHHSQSPATPRRATTPAT